MKILLNGINENGRFVMRKKIAIIIGAGPAGLTAAYSLLKSSAEIQPIILEAENFVGGDV